MPFEIEMKVTVDDQFIGDVMTTMVESGYDSIFNWDGVQVDGISRGENLTVKYIHLSCDDPNQREYEPARIEVEITPQKVAEVMGRIAGDDNLVGALVQDYVTTALQEHDAGNIDSTAADCIAQIIAFGEVVYG